jgi:mono/diheme cytochrome c family protein
MGTGITLFYQYKELNGKIDTDLMSTGEVLIALGDERIKGHLPDTTLEKVDAKFGAQLIKEGEASGTGLGATKRISPYFECTACHNIQQETPNLADDAPHLRLKYSVDHNLPFLQGSPLYGIVSRLTFYNGDYQKKYGDLATEAYDDIREAIQLCATECSQGRLLEDWELESILAYLWTIDIPFSELDLTDDEINRIKQGIRGEDSSDDLIELIQSKYITAYPATFIDPPKDRKEGNNAKGNINRGKALYTQSCLHCHADQRYSLYDLDTSYMSLNQLARRMPTYHHESVYQVARYGTQPLRGKRAYMPNYTKEKMSRQQMADLRAYIFSKMNGQ